MFFQINHSVVVVSGITNSLDVVYIIDGSSSVPRKVFDEMRKYVKNAIKLYKMSPVKTRFSIATFGKDRQHLPLSEGSTEESVRNAIDNIQKSGGDRRIDLELRKIAEDVKLAKFRKDAGKLVVLVLYGRNDINGAIDVDAASKLLRGNFFYRYFILILNHLCIDLDIFVYCYLDN